MIGEVWYAIAYATLISSALCYGLITWTNKHLSASIVTAFWPVQVLVTVILSLVVLHQPISGKQAIAGALIVLGLLLICYASYEEDRVATALRPLLTTDARGERPRARILPLFDGPAH